MNLMTVAKVRLAAFTLTLGLLASCSAPTGPITHGGTSYGTISNKDMADYYYPKEAGWTYVYKHTITEFTGGGNTVANTWIGGYDTLRTIGYVGNAPNGDSMFAFDVKYRLLSTKNTKDRFQLYYYSKNGGNSNMGGFVDGNNPSNRTGIDSISSVAGAIDTILYVTEGPTRDVVDNVTAEGTRVYRTDRIFFTSRKDSVCIWWREGTTMRYTRMLWYRDFQKNADWAYAMEVGDPYTYFEVADEDELIPTAAGNIAAARIEAFTENLRTSTVEYKWWGNFAGLIKQYDEWRVSSDGQNFRKKTRVREIISRTKN